MRFGRCTYNCTKAPTGPLNRKALLDYIYEQAKKTPDKVEYVPHVPGVIRGTKWVPPPQVTKDISVFLNSAFILDFFFHIKMHIWTQQNQLRPEEDQKCSSVFGKLEFFSLRNIYVFYREKEYTVYHFVTEN
jgi:hypothetical protein